MSDVIKILVFGDLHASEATPKSRKDEYLSSICNKVEEIVKIAKKRKVNAVISLGDIFNRMEPSGKCRNMIISLFLSLQPDIPIYTTEGNHDIKNSVSNLYRSALGTLVETDVVQHVDYEPNLGIRFGHWVPGIEEKISTGQYMDDCVIHTFHANLCDTAMMYDHLLFDNATVHPNCKLVLTGHIHRMMDKDIDGVRFINPGSICRDEMNEYLIKHHPNVLYIEYKRDGSYFNIEYIPLQNVLPPEEVFKLEEGQNKKDEKSDTQQYIQQISQLSAWSFGADKYDSLRKSGELKKIDREVVELAINTVMEVNDLKEGVS
jgi:DNA repair protein SbcD/Mre11